MRSKIQPRHLQRRACVYVRQSTMKQVLDHSESTSRQYGLVERAKQLGWCPEAIEVIDEDLGKSGASTHERSGFVRMAEAVAHGEVGAIFAIEVSRLARSSQDWQRLLSLCTVAGVVVGDECTIYDPSLSDDKLLLDLKGTMSEAELQWLGLRLYGARQSKARRGELEFRVPTGYEWNGNKFVLDPDESVQQALRTVFAQFSVEPSAWAVVRWAREAGFKVPVRQHGPSAPEKILWKPLTAGRVRDLLHNPIYAGAYAYGKRPVKKVLVDGDVATRRPYDADPEAWMVCIREAHEGYITWDAYLKNREKLRSNAQGYGARPTQGAPRKGRALLAGIALCGRCGRRMHVGYYGPSVDEKYWYYKCFGDRQHAAGACWSTTGRGVDDAVENIFLSTMLPAELDLSLAVEQEATTQAKTLSKQWHLRLERARRDAHLAERRYNAVDPENRVVARTLERQWEEALRELEEVERQYGQARRRRHVDLSDDDRASIRALAHDLPLVWKSPLTTAAERKAMLRLVVEAVTLQPVDVPRRETLIQVQWKSGAVSQVSIPRLTLSQHKATPPDSVEQVRQLAAKDMSTDEIATALNIAAVPSAHKVPWTRATVQNVIHRHRLKRPKLTTRRRPPLPDRHPDGRYSINGAAKFLGVTAHIVRLYIRRGLLTAAAEPYESYARARWLRLDETEVARFRARNTVVRAALPPRDAAGRYSIPGLAALLGVTGHSVEGWIRRGLVKGVRANHGPHRNVWWLDVDKVTLQRLQPESRRQMRRWRRPLPDRFPDGTYSVPGLARRLHVGVHNVHVAIKKGLITGVLRKYRDHPPVWWLDIEIKVAKRLVPKKRAFKKKKGATCR